MIKIWFLPLTAFLITIQIIFFKTINDLAVLLILILLIINIYLSKIKWFTLIKIGLILIFFCPFLLIAKQDFIAEKTAIWAYIFLLLGVLKKLIISSKRSVDVKKSH